MNKKKLKSYQTQLIEIRSELIGDVEKTFETSKKVPVENIPDLSDDAAMSYSRQLNLNLGEQDWQKLRQVEEALEKTANGEFGICSQCDKAIPETRLKVIPFAKYCVDCLSDIETLEKQDKN